MIHEKLLQNETISLDKALDTATTYEATLNHINQLHPTKEANAQEVLTVDTSNKLNKTQRNVHIVEVTILGPDTSVLLLGQHVNIEVIYHYCKRKSLKLL